MKSKVERLIEVEALRLIESGLAREARDAPGGRVVPLADERAIAAAIGYSWATWGPWVCGERAAALTAAGKVQLVLSSS